MLRAKYAQITCPKGQFRNSVQNGAANPEHPVAVWLDAHDATNLPDHPSNPNTTGLFSAIYVKESLRADDCRDNPWFAVSALSV
jgi:hypothetical protein